MRMAEKKFIHDDGPISYMVNIKPMKDRIDPPDGKFYTTQQRFELSARTSFALSQRALECMDWLIGIMKTPKEVFANMVGTLEIDQQFGGMEIQENYNRSDEDGPIHRKSYVLSPDSLECLNNLSKGAKIKRDLLVEQAIFLIRDRTELHGRERYKRQVDVKDRLGEFVHEALQFCEEVQQVLDRGDLLGESIVGVIEQLKQLHIEAEEHLAKGKTIEGKANR